MIKDFTFYNFLSRKPHNKDMKTMSNIVSEEEYKRAVEELQSKKKIDREELQNLAKAVHEFEEQNYPM